MDISAIKKRYENMPIDELVTFLATYNKDDFMPEVQQVIEEVLLERQDEIDSYKQQEPNEDIESGGDPSSDSGLISRKIKCKDCDYQGLVEAYDTQDYPKKQIFKLLGKDNQGYIYLRCPNCRTDISYSPFELIKFK